MFIILFPWNLFKTRSRLISKTLKYMYTLGFYLYVNFGNKYPLELVFSKQVVHFGELSIYMVIIINKF